MKGPEYDEILASLQEIIRQAYALGRSDALKQVVDVLKTDEVPPKPLALMAPPEAGSPLPSQQSGAERSDPAPEDAMPHFARDSAPDTISDDQDRIQEHSNTAAPPTPEAVTGPWWSRPSRVA